MNIEEGKFYRTRDGRKVGPMQWSGQDEWPWFDVPGSGICWMDDGSPAKFTNSPQLVSEWQDGPVRTVTRKEIVPGSYGCVVVCNDGSVSAACDTAAELRAAAATLIEIADALEDV
jgi:hypothetical protein